MVKIEGYEEISQEEFAKLPDDEGATFDDYETDEYIYFKKAQKFPICFEDDHYKIEIKEEYIHITHKKSGENFYFHNKHSFPLLVKAVEKAKEVSKLKK